MLLLLGVLAWVAWCRVADWGQLWATHLLGHHVLLTIAWLSLGAVVTRDGCLLTLALLILLALALLLLLLGLPFLSDFFEFCDIAVSQCFHKEHVIINVDCRLADAGLNS